MEDSEGDSNSYGICIKENVSYKTGEKFTIIALIANIILAVSKVLAGIYGKSHAVLADGIHSAADSFSTGLVHAAIVIAQKPRDEKCHYGYGKIESLVSSFIGMVLVVIGGYLIIASISHIINGELSEPSFIALIMTIVSIVIKGILFKYGMQLGEMLNSDAIIAISWDFRSDVYSSIGALAGVIGAMLGNMYDIYFLKIFDSIAGAVVGVIILQVSLIVIKRAYKGLMDYAPEQETLDIISNVLKEYEDSAEKKSIMARYSGSNMYVEICLKMKPSLSIRDAYRIEKIIEENIKIQIGSEGIITIDIEPNEE